LRRLVVIALVLAGVSGCGGSAEKPDDPGLETLGAFLHAAEEGNPDLMRGLLSLESSRRLGTAALSKLGARLRPLARSYRVLVSERITDDFGVAAVTGSAGVYAAALRKDGEEWRLELAGPVKIKPLGPDPGSREELVQQVAVEAEGGTGSGDALLYLDGVAIPFTKVYGGGSSFTAFANLPSPIRRGKHSIVAFAGREGDGSALAWTFSVTR
jgi:hypothetical protein